MVEAIGYSWNQEEAALYAEGKGTEAGQVLQATNNSKKVVTRHSPHGLLQTLPRLAQWKGQEHVQACKIQEVEKSA